MGKPDQRRQEKFGEKGKSLKCCCLGKYASLINFIYPKVQKYIQKCHKIAPNVITINSIPI
jgi:hypothetical protein